MRDVMLQENHGIYLRPEVRVVVEDGRSFVRRSTEKYQVLQATLVDTWASTAAGAFALSENNLYTADAFYDYLTHLTDDGVLAFTEVVGLLGPKLHPLSAIVQEMRKTEQTSQYLDSLGPFFVGKVAWQSKP